MNTVSDKQPWQSVWINARVDGHDECMIIGVNDGQICWFGAAGQADALLKESIDETTRIYDCFNQLVTPGLIDCHTHLVYAGSRANEFAMRMHGMSYQQIAKAGGGIMSTVRATREADEQTLFNQSRARLLSLMREGVTTVEIKSGYGLTLDDELKLLRVARRLGDELPVRVKTTFLGAHTIPPDTDAESYMDLVINQMLPAVADGGLADAVDAYCEDIAFNTSQVARLFDAAQKHQLPIKLHAEQFTDQKGAMLAAQHGALSVDHLEYLAPQDAAALAKAGTVAVLLPGAFYCLRETQLPPVQALRDHQMPMAIATDCNPGTSPVTSLLLMLNMSCNLFGLTVDEALDGVTKQAARALGLVDVGELKVGQRADLVCWSVQDKAELCYRVGNNPCRMVMFDGETRSIDMFDQEMSGATQ